MVEEQPMNDDDRLPSEQVPFQTVQVIAIALIAGVLVFAGVAVLNTWQKPAGDPFMSYFGIAFAVAAVPAGFVFQAVMIPNAMQQMRSMYADQPIKLFYAEYQTRLILRNAVLEGAAFFNVIAYMLTALSWSLGVALALVAVMVATFPTRSKFDNWVRRKQDEEQFHS
jgi:hypothetical protein